MITLYKNQHYLPQFYLRHFSKDKVGLIRYTIDDRKPERRNVDTTCALFYFYADKKDSATFEKMMSGLEDIYSAIVEKLLKIHDVSALTEKDHIYLCNFVLLTATRTESSKKESEMMANAFFNAMKPGLAREPEFIKQGLSKESLDEVHLVKDTANFDGMLIAMLGPYLIADLKIALLINRSKKPFIISDNPVVFYNFLKAGEMGMRGFQSPGLIILLPISEEVTVCLYDSMAYSIKTTPRGTINLTKNSEINQLNRLQIVNAEKYLMFSDEIAEEYVVELLNSTRLAEKKVPVTGWSEHETDDNTYELVKFSKPAPGYYASLPFIYVQKFYIRAYKNAAIKMGKSEPYVLVH